MASVAPLQPLNEPRTLVKSSNTALSWAAILAGAAASAAMSLVLLALGAGLGLSAVSPWGYASASPKALAAGAIIWMLLTALAASGLGGYLAGRLRAKWPDADPDESHFRDTAHGFLTWAVATLISAGVLASAASSMVGAIAKTGASAAAVSAQAAGTPAAPTPDGMRNYYTDMLLRSDKPADVNADTAGVRREVNSILLASVPDGDVSQADRSYLAQLVVNRTGLSRPEAEQRVTQTLAAAKSAMDAASAKAKEAAEATRKATMHTALWVFVSLLVGAFYASLTATWGGKQRDMQLYQSTTI